jgi:3D (Asp-Asp-Asp) domain-containing protein
VDPKVIPLGTKVWVEGYGEAIAGDTGGAIKGNKIDVFIPSYGSAMEWGVKKVKIKVHN